MATETVFANADIENQHGNTMGSEKTEAYTLGSPTTTFVDSQASEIENVDPDGEEMPFLKENQDRSDIVQASNPQRLSRWVARIYKMIPWLQKPWHTEVRSCKTACFFIDQNTVPFNDTRKFCLTFVSAAVSEGIPSFGSVYGQ